MLTLNASEAARVARFATRAEAGAAADAAGLGRSAVGEAALFALRFFVIRGPGGPMSTAELQEAAFVFGRCGKAGHLAAQGIRRVWDRVWDTLEEVPLSRTICGPCYMKSARNHYDIRGKCPACGHVTSTANVRPFTHANELHEAEDAADYLAGRYLCAYGVIASSPMRYKIVPLAKVPEDTETLYETEEPC
jgi:hypothetical protein